MGLIRFALLLFLVYVGIKLLKALFGPRATRSRQPGDKPTFDAGPRQVSEMVQDPVCRVYVPKKEALRLDYDGTSHYFCSQECKEKFQKRQS